MNSFIKAWAATGKSEGGYSNNPEDHGGETMWGITAAVARRHGYFGPMREMPRPTAEAIAKKEYWDVMRLDDIAALSEPIALELFDSGFNAGPTQPGLWLQRMLDVLNQDEKFYVDLAVDGKIGPATVTALRTFLTLRGKDGETVMLRGLNSLQCAFYVATKQEAFIYGWILNRVVI